MAIMALSLIGSAIGSGLAGAAGLAAGQFIGAAAGLAVQGALSASRVAEGPRLASLEVMGASEGAPIPRVYGRMRVAGEVIWATTLEEASQVSGGKGLGGPKVRAYSYFGNFAVGLCEGPVAAIGRIWADGKELDQTHATIRFHSGDESQSPDPLILAKEGDEGAPAYRGLAYLVFERLSLDLYGNRLPQIAVEVIRPVGRAEIMTRGLVMIPGATEFGYATDAVDVVPFSGRTDPETHHTRLGQSDFLASLEEAMALCPHLERVALVVSWFATDLRAGHCQIRPAVSAGDRVTRGAQWQVGPVTRSTATLVSQVDGRAAYGGTPSDRTVIDAIRAMTARGLKVTLIPFVMVDVPAANSLPDPWTGGASQPAYPWRGRITVHPAPGQPGTVDGTAAAATQIAAFVGTAQVAHVQASGTTIGYSGPAEWSYRRMILHMAKLAALAGGVDTFAIGSEMIGLTRARSAAGTYPFVDALVALAADVKTILPATALTYAADWTEYGAHVIGSDIRFPLDPLWSSPSIAAVGIDFYPPLSDLRDGDDELARDARVFRAGLRAGEGFDWYYANDAARLAAIRTPITDGLGKPWIHRPKDLAGWWSNAHVTRVGGVETTATAWVPQSKPVWLMEFGVAAMHRATNRPSVFPDAKSSEAGLPPFSSGARDDMIQRRAIEGVLSGIDPAFGATLMENPVSGVTGARMIDPGHVQLWCWDARPWPAFPRATGVWADGPNWETGHWLTGRYGSAPLADLCRAICAEHGLDDVDVSALDGIVDGAAIDRPMSIRQALEPLGEAFGFGVTERAGKLVFQTLPESPAASLSLDDLVEPEDERSFSLTRTQASDLPCDLSVTFAETDRDYQSGAVIARREAGASRRTTSLALAVAGDGTAMMQAATACLHRIWAARDSAAFTLPPSRLALEPGDVVLVTTPEGTHRLRLTGLEGDGARTAEARSASPAITPAPAAAVRRPYAVPARPGPPVIACLDLPTLSDDKEPPLLWLAAAAEPWTGPLAVWRMDGASATTIAQMTAPSLIGFTQSVLPAGPVWRLDRAASVTVRWVRGLTSSVPDLALLSGANAMAVQGPLGWEVLQHRDAELVASDTTRLSGLLRGQRGTEHRVAAVPAGAMVVALSGPMVALATGLDSLGRPLTWVIGPAGDGPGSPIAVTLNATVLPTALHPWSPVHLAARRAADGIAISWIRRTRVGGDPWEVADVPLGETGERYRVEILAGTAVLRTVEVTTPAWLYPAAQEVADFGAPVTSLSVRITQMSAAVGTGVPASAVFML